MNGCMQAIFNLFENVQNLKHVYFFWLQINSNINNIDAKNYHIKKF